MMPFTPSEQSTRRGRGRVIHSGSFGAPGGAWMAPGHGRAEQGTTRCG
jgi:hypothetical protein